MDELNQVFTNGTAALVVLGVVVLEAGLLFLRWRRGLGAPMRRWAPQVLAGAALVLALISAQLDAPFYAVAVFLSLAGIAHLTGFRERWLP